MFYRKKKKIKWWALLFNQLKSPLVYILIVGAFVTGVIGDYPDMTFIFIAVFLNVSVGFFQEFRSNNILEKLKKIVSLKALVIRENENIQISSSDLVPGDLILLKQGSKIPADVRIIKHENLKINEAVLTGESNPVKKNASFIHEDASLGDRKNMAYMGTLVERGQGVAIVVETGVKTEVGKIALLTQSATIEKTPLQIRIGKLGGIITIAAIGSAAFIFTIGLIEKFGFRDIFTTSIAISIAAIPEGLPAAISIILAIGAQRILKKKGVIKRIIATETLGSTTVIATDKTGTLTKGIIVIERLLVWGNQRKEALKILALSNEAVVENSTSRKILGEPTDVAKMNYFIEEGGNIKKLKKDFPKIGFLPFKSQKNYVASFHGNLKKMELFVSGSPEAVLKLSQMISSEHQSIPLNNKERTNIIRTYETLAQKGYRIIALAKKKISPELDENHFENEKKSRTSCFKFNICWIRDHDRPVTSFGCTINKNCRESRYKNRNLNRRSQTNSSFYFKTIRFFW